MLAKNSDTAVWLPAFFSPRFKDSIRKKGGKVVEVTNFKKICSGASTTGIIEGWIKEQSLILETDKGLIVITGCAHPRIVKIIDIAKDLLNNNIDMVLGGFHLAAYVEREIKAIINHFQGAGVKKVGPCHCTGDEARRLFSEKYKDDFIDIGVGRELIIP